MFRRVTVASLLILVLAAPASAGTVTIGSDLKASATKSVSNPQDWSAWSTKLPGRKFRSPVTGELNVVRIKGRALQHYTAPVSTNVQVLHPKGHGKVQATVTSLPLPIPSTGADDNIISTFGRSVLEAPTSRMCVKKGDYVSIFLNGGAQVRPGGVQLQVFGASPGATTTVFKTKAGDTPPGQAKPFKGRAKKGQELLLQADIGTELDARYSCETPYQQQHGGHSPGRARAALL
jgi:hypothetical protein